MFFLDFELPLASIWVPMGSLFGIVFSTLFLNVKMAQDWTPPLPPNGQPAARAAPSGSVGILHFSLLEEVIMWVLARFSIFRLCAAP